MLQGLFFHFHRYLTWLYEKALQDECGYKGTQPYWDWTISWEDPRKSTVFDGSATSIGGNGKVIPHGNINISAFGLNLSLPPGTGGGCVETGPFANTTVNLGPIAFQPEGPDNGLGYNPRCFSRDINLNFSNQTKPTDVVKLLSSCTDLGCFDTVFEAIDGVHAGGHFTMGSLGYDAFASPGDPAFYLHHSSIDRMWSIWQGLNPGNRTNQVFGTSTAFNSKFHLCLRLGSLVVRVLIALSKQSLPAQTSRLIPWWISVFWHPSNPSAVLCQPSMVLSVMLMCSPLSPRDRICV